MGTLTQKREFIQQIYIADPSRHRVAMQLTCGFCCRIDARRFTPNAYATGTCERG